MVKRICCVKPNPAKWEGPEDMPLTNPVRHKMMREPPAHIEEFYCHHFPVSDLTVRDAVAQLEELNALDLIGIQSSRGQVSSTESLKAR